MRAGGVYCVLVVLLAAASSTQATFIDDLIYGIQGLFAHYEEAPFNSVGSNPDFEERQYPARKWVCTREVGSQVELEPLFRRLFRYISGNNVDNVTIPMTIPVSTEVTFHSDDNTSNKEYTMCFFIGEAHQSSPPSPGDSAVFIQDRPAISVLTRRVGGYMRSESAWMEEAGRLAVVLQQHGQTVPLSHVYWVGYDAPFKFWNRRNEVWFPVN